MVKKRSTVLLVFGLVFLAGVLFLTIDVKRTEFGSLYRPHFIDSTYLQLRLTLQVTDPVQITAPVRNCSGGTLIYDKYCVVSPYENEIRNTSQVGNVTLCTQGTVEFLQHVSVLCHRWSAPLSVAVYSPQEDYVEARVLVHLLRQCDSCVRYWVNWHFFFPEQTELPRHNQPQLVQNCSSISQMKKSKKRRSQGMYPINVGRNVARILAATPFVFSIDIELYPSLGIPAKFERMLQSRILSLENQVWVFPVFEVYSKVRAPLNKSELRRLYSKKQAISFHQYRCSICHRIPNLTQWMSHEEGRATSEVGESLEPLKIWTTVKRSRGYKLQEWEPFFIGTTKDPEFDIRLSWEGKQNKMQMAYEMCMRDYNFHIIENAFLVHSPGINVYNASKEKERVKYLSENEKVIKMIKKDLIQKYGSKKDC